MGDALSRAGGADESGTWIEAEEGTQSTWEADGSRTVVTQANSRFYHYVWVYNNLNISPPIEFYKTRGDDDDDDNDDDNDNGEEIGQGKSETEIELTDIVVDTKPDEKLRHRSRGTEDKEDKEEEEPRPEYEELDELEECAERDTEESSAGRRVRCYEVVNPEVYDAFLTFEALRGLEGSLLWALQQKSQKNGTGNVAPYDWCLKKFSAGLECHTATLNFVTEATKFLRDLETPPEQGAVIDPNLNPNPRVAELLALSEEIEDKKRGLIEFNCKERGT